MSNPVLFTGNLTREVATPVEAFRLVKEEKGKVAYCDAATFPFGAVSEPAAPKADGEAGDLSRGLPYLVRVHAAQCVVKIATDETELEAGAKLYAAADGKVAKTGTVAVGIAHKPEVHQKLACVHLFHPSVLV